jgi:hypothetical protein
MLFGATAKSRSANPQRFSGELAAGDFAWEARTDSQTSLGQYLPDTGAGRADRNRRIATVYWNLPKAPNVGALPTSKKQGSLENMFPSCPG